MNEGKKMIDLLIERRKAALQLIPCPFCGGTGKDTLNIMCDEYGRFYVLCYQDLSGAGCGMESGRRHSIEDLIASWNTRTVIHIPGI